MRKRIVWFVIVGSIFLISLFKGCSCNNTWEIEQRDWEAPNWTSDGKIVFLEHHFIQKWKHEITGDNQAGGTEEITVYEINSDKTGLRKVAKILGDEFEYGPDLGGINTSSAGDWIVMSIEDWKRGDHYPVMYVLKRDGTNLKEIGSGLYPDFSPNAEKIVYQKKDGGIWIMNRDGSGEHCIVPDPDAKYPAWSADGKRIAYVVGYPNVDTLLVVDTTGILLRSFSVEIDMPDWGPIDSSAVSGSGGGHARIIYYDSGNVNNLSSVPAGWGGGAKWSPEESLFIGWVSGEFCITDRISGSKWYLKP